MKKVRIVPPEDGFPVPHESPKREAPGKRGTDDIPKRSREELAFTNQKSPKKVRMVSDDDIASESQVSPNRPKKSRLKDVTPPRVVRVLTKDPSESRINRQKKSREYVMVPDGPARPEIYNNHGYSVAFYDEDVWSLAEGEWLTDAIITFETLRLVDNCQDRDRVFLLDCLHYTVVSTSKEHEFPCPYGKELILIPANIKNEHWCLFIAAVDYTKRNIWVRALDSLYKTRSTEIVKKWLRNHQWAANFKISGSTVPSPSQGSNSTDCGLFVLQNIEMALSNVQDTIEKISLGTDLSTWYDVGLPVKRRIRMARMIAPHLVDEIFPQEKGKAKNE